MVVVEPQAWIYLRFVFFTNSEGSTTAIGLHGVFMEVLELDWFIS